MTEMTSGKTLAIGLLETRGIVALTAGIEAMMKTADVRCIASSLPCARRSKRARRR